MLPLEASCLRSFGLRSVGGRLSPLLERQKNVTQVLFLV
jgi:hypothetical protein